MGEKGGIMKFDVLQFNYRDTAWLKESGRPPWANPPSKMKSGDTRNKKHIVTAKQKAKKKKK